jgi:hypothetical protein
MKAMSGRPVDFTTNSRLIFSVVRRGATTSTTNYNKDILYQRYEFGAISGTSALTTRGAGSFSGGPDYTAAGADTDSSLQITNLPAGLLTTAGDMVYITEIYTKHELITPFDKFGVKVPDILYSIAYF